MIGYNENDGGRREAGYKGLTSDCVVRAFAIASGRPYKDIYKLVSDLKKEAGHKGSARTGAAAKVTSKVAKVLGFKKVKLPKGTLPTYSQAYEQYGDCVVSTNGHVCAIIAGALEDIFDGRTYEWDEYGAMHEPEIRERKARSVWVLQS